MNLHSLSVPLGATKKRKRRGRGESSGLGKTAGRGGKGQTARTGKGKPGRGFEGGQMPMYRRMPKRGFVNAFAQKQAAINIDTLLEHFGPNATVNRDTLLAAGLIAKTVECIRILGRGDCTTSLTVEVDHVTQQARVKIEAAGGRCAQRRPVASQDLPNSSEE